MEAHEIFKPIDGYSDTYEVSNTGKVRSVKRNKLLKPQTNTKWQYQQVMLWKNCHAKLHYIHRLVATAFEDNPNNYHYVKFIDGDCHNCNADNLYWAKQINPKTK